MADAQRSGTFDPDSFQIYKFYKYYIFLGGGGFGGSVPLTLAKMPQKLELYKKTLLAIIPIIAKGLLLMLARNNI